MFKTQSRIVDERCTALAMIANTNELLRVLLICLSMVTMEWNGNHGRNGILEGMKFKTIESMGSGEWRSVLQEWDPGRNGI